MSFFDLLENCVDSMFHFSKREAGRVWEGNGTRFIKGHMHEKKVQQSICTVDVSTTLLRKQINDKERDKNETDRDDAERTRQRRRVRRRRRKKRRKVSVLSRPE